MFISFAMEDEQIRDLMVGQARNPNTPFEFTDMSVKEPWSNAWKTQCRERIRGCDGMIALVTKNTMQAAGARWEIGCAREERVPVLGVHVYKDSKGAIPPELHGYRVIEWSWDGITAFINGLP